MFLPIVLITLSALLHSASAGCRVYLNGNLTQPHAPLFIKQSGSNSYELQVPTGPFFEWRQGESFVVACSLAKNVLSKTGTARANLTCIEGLNFILNGKPNPVNFSEINCNSAVSAVVMPSDVACADGVGRVYNIGFQVESVQFLKYFQVCYNLADSSAIYSQHQILGKAIGHAQINNNRPAFKMGGVPSSVRLASIYTQRHQLEHFSTVLGSVQQASKFISSSSYLAKGHLTPDGDAVLDSWAGATYFYINAAPEWQAVNGGNWKRVENAARKVASQLNDTVHVYSGVYDVLKLPDMKGNLVALSLGDDGAVPVPKWLWKVVVHQPSSKGIALITLNNPFANVEETLCEDICSRYGWSQKEFKDTQKGFTYCCSVAEARKAIKLISKSIKCNGVLALE